MAERPPDAFPSAPLRWLLRLYRLLWVAGLPLAVAYFCWRALRDRRYAAHLGERFGHGPTLPNAVWIHAPSLGELRSAVPLIRGLLDGGERVVVTCLTPAGRHEAMRVFDAERASGRVVVRYLPLEYDFAYRRFLQACKPVCALVLEFDLWPVMITSARRRGVPLYLCNTQVTTRNLGRRGLAAARMKLLEGVRGAFAKSERHAERLRALGTPNVRVTGELRFDQPIPPAMSGAARTFVREHGLRMPGRPVVTLASVVHGEDGACLELIGAVTASCANAGRPRPLFVYVPRAPERFDEVARSLARAGQRVVRRSEVLDAKLAPTVAPSLGEVDVLLGDSLGEMQFYLALADIVIVGGGFLPTGAHNIIEPLAQRKPVLVGPHLWTIEFPAVEAIDAGVALKVETVAELASRVDDLLGTPERIAEIAAKAAAFHERHAGGTARTLAAIAEIQGPPPDYQPLNPPSTFTS